MNNVTDIPSVRLITVSGRIASGSTTLAKKLANYLNWKHMEGGDIFWEAVRRKLGLDPKDTGKRPDQEDRAFDEYLKEVLQKESHIVVETKLAGFNAQGIENVFKILVLCNDSEGNDQTNIRIDRLVNREHISIDHAKEEVLVREKSDIEKWRNMYAQGDPGWTYWNEKYYDLVINTYTHDPDATLKLALDAIGYK